MSPPDDRAATPGAARHARLGTLFEQALAVAREDRAAFVAQACADDATMYADLTALLEAHDSAPDYFDELSVDVVEPALSAIVHGSGEARSSDALDTLQEKLAGTYRIEYELGGSGMSRVFVAQDMQLKRKVVIKVLPPEMALPNVEHFQREIELAAQLQHPHIVPVLATDSVDGMLYYTMPFVTGESLSERIAREGPLPVPDALRIWRDILDALTHAHASGVVHRDIKPGNILLSGRHALVTDFGIASAMETVAGDAWAATSGLVIGTPAYMAPEVAEGKREVDQRVDIYAAGLVMYEMLAGAPPFVARSAHEYLLAHRKREPPPITRPDAPAGLIALVMRCLVKDPGERPQSTDAVLAEIDAAVADHAPPAASAPHPARSRHLARYAVATLILAATASIGVWMIRPGPSAGGRATGRGLSIAAYEWYQRGMDVALLRTDSGLLRGVEYFQRALAIDSTYVDAYAGLARMYVGLSNAAPDPQRLELLDQAHAVALEAVALDSANADARVALGWVRLLYGDYAAARDEFARAVALDPRVPRGYEGLARALMMLDRPAGQLAAARAGLEIDPLSHSAIREMALALAVNGRCQESLDDLLALKTLTPPAGVAGLIRGQCYASLELWPEAIEEFRWAADHSATAALSFLGYVLARAGQQAEADSILADLLSGRAYSHGAFGVATVYTGMRDYDQAFAWLDRAIDEQTLSFYIMHPVFADLHRDARFARVKERLGSGAR